MNIVEVQQVSKTYRNGVKALDGITLSIKEGVYGLLGHNGAGKTTLMKVLATISRPSCGRIAVCGHDTVSDGAAVRLHLGYLPQELALLPHMTAFSFVSYIAAIKGVYDKNTVLDTLAQVGLEEVAHRKIKQLSGGMKRRVGIAQALIGKPRVLIVDEPTAGLDPQERVRFRGILSQYATNGKAVILSTHIVEDVYQLCQSLAVLRKGRLFYQGSAEGMIGQVAGKIKVVRIRNEADLAQLQQRALLISTTYESEGILARIADHHHLFPRIEPCQATLEDAYVYCMGGETDA